MEKIKSLKFNKRNKLISLNIYDKSTNVNSFIFNGIEAWIDRNTRVSLMNSTTIKLKLKQSTTALWLNGIRLEIDCQTLINLLEQLEIYALNCYDVTEQHRANINAIEDLDELESYDFTTGYPEKLNITLN